MTPLQIGTLSAVAVFGGVLVGFWLQRIVPQHHLTTETKETVQLGAGMVATMAALVLGLLVSSSNSSFNAVNSGIAEFGTKIILLDRALASYGTETKELRQFVRSSTESMIRRVWGKDGRDRGGLKASESLQGLDVLQEKLNALTPSSPAQTAALAKATQIGSDILQARVSLLEQEQDGLPPVLLALLMIWLVVLFVSFGLFAPRNVTVYVVLLICSLSVSSAVYLILEMNQPLDGFIHASNAPLRKALEMIGK